VNTDENECGATYGWRMHEARGRWERSEAGAMAPILVAVGVLVLFYLLFI
jgi:hypothetical protein